MLTPEQEAAYAFVETMVPKCDDTFADAPLWHGWALREAFEAGVKWAREQQNR